MPTKTFILAEHDQSGLHDITFELLGMANALPDAEVTALLLGSGVDGLADELAARGANEVIYIDGAALADYTGDGYQKAIVPLIRDEQPRLVLIGNTPNGWDVAPLVAARLAVALATGCSEVSLDGSEGRFKRKAFNGKFVHEVSIAADQTPLMATIDKGAAAAFEGQTTGTVKKVESSVQDSELRSRFVEVKTGESSGLDLTQAPVIVAGGRGIGDAEKVDVVRELADSLGGQLGASRAVTDAGWLPHEHQIGSSGVTVSPKLYVACGISGAIQHVVGMKSSGYIVAINKDGDAPIFGVADVGVVGDLFEIVPAITKAVQEAKG